MVLFGNAIVGGKDIANSKEYLSGIVFELSAETKRKKSYIFDDWEVEINESNFIVARTSNGYSRDKTHELGYAVCEKALDLYFAEGFGAYSIIEPYNKHIDLTLENGEYSLYIHDICNISMDACAKATVVDKDGNVIPSAPVSQPSWEFIFRYYRFSQTSNNMYDAYRWMYLVFEILMQAIAPIELKANGKPAEGERAWVDRALCAADETYHWSTKVTWSASDYVAYFLSDQYDNIRCNLFHSKGNRILPNEQLGQHTVHKMLLELEALCLCLMGKLYPIRKGSGGVTYQGFALMMKAGFENTTAFISSMALDLCNATGEVALVNPLLLLEADSTAATTTLGVDTRVYSKTLSLKKEYSVRAYGINKGSNILTLGNFDKMVLSINKLSKFTIVMKTQLINRGDTKHYL